VAGEDVGELLQQRRFGVGRQGAFGDVHVEHGRDYAPNTMGNFCFEVTLSYRRLERPRRGGGG
jgi:hypothetical protein